MAQASNNIGQFEIRGMLGQGAMAVVWRAYDPQLDREVAIKEAILPAGATPQIREEFSERFVREARAAARLSNPGIVTIYSAAVYDERPVIVMELIEGPTLRQVLAKGALSTRQTYALMDQLLQAVAYAHENGVTHRDLKPDNVFVARDGSVKLADFGIAQLGPKGTININDSDLAHRDSSALTRVGTMLGTPAYMAPEQVRGESVDARCDVFALGVVAYECLSGANPFGNESSTHFATILHRIMSEPTPPLEVDDAVAGPLAGVIMRALDKEREGRYQNATAMLAAWREAFSATIDTKAELVALGGSIAATVAVPLIAERTRQWGIPGTAGATAGAEPVSEKGRMSEEIVPPTTTSAEPGRIEAGASGEVQPAATTAPRASTTRRARRLIGVAALAAALVVGSVIARGIDGAEKTTPPLTQAEPSITVEPTEAAPAVPPAPPAEVTLKASKSRDAVKTGQSVRIKVVATSSNKIENGTVIILERKYSGGSWKKLRELRLKNGGADLSVTLKRTASFRFRLEATDLTKAAVSSSVKVRHVAPAPPEPTFSQPAPEPTF